jgi:hypothetical protein
MVQVGSAIDLTDVSGSPDDYGYGDSDGATFQLTLDVGLTRRVQLGILVELPLAPSIGFGTALGSLQVGLHRLTNLRFDVGIERLLNYANNPNASDVGGVGFTCGIGLPLLVRLHRMLAFTSGSTSAQGYGARPHPQVGGTYSSGGGVGFSDDIVSVFLLSSSDQPHQTLRLAAVTTSFTLPLGLLFQPHERFAMRLRTGYRLVAATGFGVAHYVPLALDLVGTPIPSLDVGFTATIFGNVAHTQVPLTAADIGWGQDRDFQLWVRARF